MTNTFFIASGLWTFGWFILLVLPLVLYAKFFLGLKNEYETKSILTRILVVFFLHFAYGFFFFVFAYTIGEIIKIQDYNPCAGLRFALFGIKNASCNMINYNGQPLWDIWTTIVSSLTTSTNPINSINYKLAVVYYFFANVVFFILILYFFVPFFLAIKSIFDLKTQAQLRNEDISLGTLFFKSIFITIISFLIILFHFQIITSITVSIAKVSNFNAFSLMQIAVKSILGV